MARLAAEAISCITYYYPSGQAIELFFDPEAAELAEDEYEQQVFDEAVPLEAEHLLSLDIFNELTEESGEVDHDAVYNLLKEAAEKSYPFGFWKECFAISDGCDSVCQAFIMFMLNEQAVLPEESIHALFTTALEAGDCGQEFAIEDYEILGEAIDISRQKLNEYAPQGAEGLVKALFDCYLGIIDSGGEKMDRQLADIENVYLKMIPNH